MDFKKFEEMQGECKEIGNDMYDLIEELYPICRSITGNGVRQSLEVIKKHINLDIVEVPTGTKVFDWTIPKEWNIKDAYIIDPKGNKIVDFKSSNLHILNYSIPIKKKISLKDLKPHLHSLPEQPELIPYLTTYYKEEWGFCLSHKQLLDLEEGEYEVVIDSTLKMGSLSYGEYIIKGKTKDEVVLSCYICHPSLCNDNLSGVVLTTFLAKIFSNIETKYSYRFLFLPETIGTIAWLAKNENNIERIKHGLVVTCVGDLGNLTYKKSRIGNAEIDKIVENVLKFSGENYSIRDFDPIGSDERQFCSPGFNLPFGSLMRTPYGEFLEYHTSGDNLNLVKPEFLFDTYSKYFQTMFILENNKKYLNLNPKCEPQFGKRGLFRLVGGQNKTIDEDLAKLWLFNMSDGENTLVEISNKSGISFEKIKNVADKLLESGLLK